MPYEGAPMMLWTSVQGQAMDQYTGGYYTPYPVIRHPWEFDPWSQGMSPSNICSPWSDPAIGPASTWDCPPWAVE